MFVYYSCILQRAAERVTRVEPRITRFKPCPLRTQLTACQVTDMDALPVPVASTHSSQALAAGSPRPPHLCHT